MPVCMGDFWNSFVLRHLFAFSLRTQSIIPNGQKLFLRAVKPSFCLKVSAKIRFSNPIFVCGCLCRPHVKIKFEKKVKFPKIKTLARCGLPLPPQNQNPAATAVTPRHLHWAGEGRPLRIYGGDGAPTARLSHLSQPPLAATRCCLVARRCHSSQPLPTG